MEQKALIIKEGYLDELNKFLSHGWHVVETCPMPSSCGNVASSFYPTCLVVIERNQ